MSAKSAQALGAVVADNVRRWRVERGLDQGGLSERLAALGWEVARPIVNRIERKKRNVTVDDLGLLAVALNVPLPLLLLPVHEGGNVSLTPQKRTSVVDVWMLWEWMLGNSPLPGRLAMFGDEWRSGAAPLWLYERVQIARRALQRDDDEPGAPERRPLLQQLVDTTADMEAAGMPTHALIAGEWAREIESLGVKPSTRPGRYSSVDEFDDERGGG
jgi:transcriptional regulator with XRE-family HTH domain